MAIRAQRLNRFQYRTGNVVGVRPASAYGLSLTPGNNSYPAYVSLLTGGNIANDCYFVVVNINSVGVSAAARDLLVTLGKDDSGGTTYVDWIPHLLGSHANGFIMGGGIWYAFPLFVPAGAQIAAKASVNNATVGTARICIWLFGLPTAPEMMRWGTYVDAIGANTAASNGTTVTSGTTGEGSWTSLGTESREHWWWQLGMGMNDATLTGLSYFADLSHGDGSNKHIIFEDLHIANTSAELVSFSPEIILPNYYAPTNGAETIYGRLQCSSTADSGLSLAAYGVGG
jgi:hypothetical protein